MKNYYAIINPNDDNCFSGLGVVFGNQESIDDDRLQLGNLPYDTLCQIGDAIEDTGESGEDYALVSSKYTKRNQTNELRSVLDNFGFIENTALKTIGWG